MINQLAISHSRLIGRQNFLLNMKQLVLQNAFQNLWWFLDDLHCKTEFLLETEESNEF